MGTIDKPTKGALHLCGHRIDSNTTDETLSYIRLKKNRVCFSDIQFIELFDCTRKCGNANDFVW